MSELSIDEVIPRHEEENPYNYTNLEKAQRSKAIKDMIKDYPNIPRKSLKRCVIFPLLV